MSLIKNETSVIAGLATAAVVVAVYQGALPSFADERVSPPHDDDLAGSEKSAAWTAAALVGGISLITQDPTIFVMGAGTIIALSWLHRHANAFDPLTGRAAGTASDTAQLAAA